MNLFIGSNIKTQIIILFYKIKYKIFSVPKKKNFKQIL